MQGEKILVFFQTLFYLSFCCVLKVSRLIGENSPSKVPTQIRLYHMHNPSDFFFPFVYSQRVTHLGILCWNLKSVLWARARAFLILKSLVYLTDILMKQASIKYLYSVSCNYLTSSKNCFNIHKKCYLLLRKSYYYCFLYSGPQNYLNEGTKSSN